MTDHEHGFENRTLDADLAALRARLRRLNAPVADAEALRAAFRQQGPRRAQPRASGRPRTPPKQAYFAVAASLLLGLMILVGSWVQTDRGEQPAVELAGSDRAEPLLAAAPALQAFHPLLASPGLSPTGSYSIVRVLIPLSSLVVMSDGGIDGMIEAELLVGEDGLARGIRFQEPEALLVSAQAP